MIQQGGWSFTARTILVEDTNREPLEFSLVHRLRDDLQVGIEAAIDAEKFYPMANYRILEATDDQPALVLGTSSAWPSDDVGGNAVTLTAAQMLGPRVSGSLSLSYMLENSKWRVPASLHYGIRPNLDGTLMYDGQHLHPLLTWRSDNLSFSFILLNVSDPALSVSVGF